MLKWGLFALALLLASSFGGFVALSWRSEIPAVGPPLASTFSPALVAQGEALAGGGNCAACHTTRGGKPYAGGYPIRTSFGTIYSTSITPDPQTGIGAWSRDAFDRAMREGVARDGSHLFPAFPYVHFAMLTESDIAALYAYLMTRDPVSARPARNTLPFPLNVRALQAGWKMLFFRPAQSVTRPDRSPDWTRGAYLAEGLAHCGACHTPLNALGAEIGAQAFAGAEVDGWLAPALTGANPSPAPWSPGELFAYLRTGVSPLHGTAVGPMSSVIHDGLVGLPDSDIHALAAYFSDLAGATARAAETPRAIRRAAVADVPAAARSSESAARLYAAACGACHYNGDGAPNPLRPDLALNSAVNLADPTNLLHVILKGVGEREGAPGIVMPGFAPALGDADIAGIATYLRATRTDRSPWPDLEKQVAAARRAP